MMPLSTLVDELQADCPPVDGAPTDAQYEKAVKDSVADFGRRAGRIKRETLNIVSGTQAYDLPADFISLVNLIALYSDGNVLNTPQGLIPLSGSYYEEYLVVNRQIKFYPTPQYSLEREYRYKAGWALTVDSGGDFYEELNEDEAAIALLLARSLVNRQKANALGGGVNYQQGDVRVETTSAAAELVKSVESLRSDYLAAVEQFVGMQTVYGEMP